LDPWYAELQEGWQIFKADVRQIAEECKRLGIPFLAYVIPGAITLDSRAWDYLVTHASVDVRYDRSKEVTLAKELDAEVGIAYCDVFSALHDRASNPSQNYEYHGHFSRVGAKLVAETLLACLTRSQP
jgi:hypothetical protein